VELEPWQIQAEEGPWDTLHEEFHRASRPRIAEERRDLTVRRLLPSRDAPDQPVHRRVERPHVRPNPNWSS
jgi:hypothetical protein